MCRHYLSSQAVASQVFSAQVSLTAVFGMGTGGPWWTLTAISTDYSIPQNLASMDKPTRCLSMETKKQRRERAFTLAWKRAIRSLLLSGDPYESRTRVCGVRGRRLNHLTNGPYVTTTLGFPLGCITHPSGSGTPSGTRTLDTLIKSQVLYQLS